MDPDAEVQGEICLSVQMLKEVRGCCLRCHVLQARYDDDGEWCGGWSENEQESTGLPSCLGCETTSLLGHFWAQNQDPL